MLFFHPPDRKRTGLPPDREASSGAPTPPTPLAVVAKVLVENAVKKAAAAHPPAAEPALELAASEVTVIAHFLSGEEFEIKVDTRYTVGKLREEIIGKHFSDDQTISVVLSFEGKTLCDNNETISTIVGSPINSSIRLSVICISSLSSVSIGSKTRNSNGVLFPGIPYELQEGENHFNIVPIVTETPGLGFGLYDPRRDSEQKEVELIIECKKGVAIANSNSLEFMRRGLFRIKDFQFEEVHYDNSSYNSEATKATIPKQRYDRQDVAKGYTRSSGIKDRWFTATIGDQPNEYILEAEELRRVLKDGLFGLAMAGSNAWECINSRIKTVDGQSFIQEDIKIKLEEDGKIELVFGEKNKKYKFMCEYQGDVEIAVVSRSDIDPANNAISRKQARLIRTREGLFLMNTGNQQLTLQQRT